MQARQEKKVILATKTIFDILSMNILPINKLIKPEKNS